MPGQKATHDMKVNHFYYISNLKVQQAHATYNKETAQIEFRCLPESTFEEVSDLETFSPQIPLKLTTIK